MSFVSTLLSDLKFAVTHPATVKKELAAAATTVLGDIAVFNTLVHVPGQVGAVIAGVQGVAVFVLAFLGDNQSVAAAKLASAKKA